MNNVPKILQSFLSDSATVIQQGDAREESFYPAFAETLKSLLEEFGKPEIHITTLPKRTEAGNPDFRLWDGCSKIVGYIEAKAPGADLDKIEDSEQLRRYRSAFPNVILTDFFEYRLYEDGELTDRVSIGRSFVAIRLGETPPVEHTEAFTELLEAFLSHSVPRALRASSLARELAKRTRFLEHVIEHELTEKNNRELLGYYKAFRQFLIAGLDKKAFADLYAQTVTYGLFAARTRHRGEQPFTRSNAVTFIPRTIGILHDVFEFISYRELPQNIGWIVDDITEVLDAADIRKILKRYYDEGRGRDPIIHFYETFLAEYDPDLREQRGVYYTPESVVAYIVRSVHQILKQDFGKPLGLADSSVTVLDPAAGTLTFIAQAIKLAVNEYTTTYGKGGVKDLIKDHLLEHFYAFELMMAPYAIGHLKMGFILDELGYHLSDDERFKLYLTNSLEMEELEQTELPGMASLSEESRAAGKIKKEEPVLVILGNPPYSGNSFNQGKWIDDLLKKGYKHPNGHEDDGYYSVDGKPLGERNPKMLQDDYVKFIRFAQWKIDQNGQGIVSMISNHGYLDNPTFRGMRESLMKSFHEISVLDLHGNARKKETTPDGGQDDNVFDIQQGVAIHVMVKKEGIENKIQRGDVYGLRAEKYEWLEERNARDNEYEEISPNSPFYFFTEIDYDLEEKYNRFTRITDIYEVYSTGIKTHRDKFVIDIDKEALIRRITTFLDSNNSDEQVRLLYDLKDNRDWKLPEKRKSLQETENWKQYLTKILYRPFDFRHIFYHHDAIDFGREEIMRHLIGTDNIAINIGRQWSVVGSEIFDVVLISDRPVDTNLYRRGGEIVCPLYIYPEINTNKRNTGKGGGTMMLVFERDAEYTDRRPNINKEYYNLLESAYGKRPTPEEILYYTYAILYAPTYRQTYAEFLKSDFPRVPFTRDYALFSDMAELGEELAQLHLMKSDKLNNPITKFQGDGSNVVHKSKKVGRNYQPDEERVYINKDGQYFEGIPEDVWEYQVGGYQVLDKYLYDRRDRRLNNDEIQRYCRVATALYHTIQLQQAIDDLYPGAEEEIVAWK